MTAVWCALGYMVVNNRVLGAPIRRWGHVLLPVVLIGLGVYILSGAAILVR
jgi:cadmium resistance protein CadD (predicted permease)